MATPFEQPSAPIEKKDEPANSPLIPGKEYTLGEKVKGSGEDTTPEQNADNIARALGHNDPELTKKYLNHEDV